MEIIVGRKGKQQIAITDLSVSKEHCKLTSNPDGTYTLENLSRSGTFIDGRSIIRSTVTPDTIIQLGATFRVSVKELLPVVSKQTKSADPHQQEYETRFRKLKDVYDKYQKEKLAIQKEANMTNFLRILPMTLLSLIGLGATAIPALENIAPVLGIVGIGLLIFSLVKSYNGSKDNPEKMEALNKQFMIDYVCPNCGNFLGYVPYENLEQKSTCNYCKCKWV